MSQEGERPSFASVTLYLPEEICAQFVALIKLEEDKAMLRDRFKCEVYLHIHNRMIQLLVKVNPSFHMNPYYIYTRSWQKLILKQILTGVLGTMS